MKERICGPCARIKAIGLLERHELAVGRIPGENYLCLICNTTHSLPIIPGINNTKEKEPIEQIKLF
jgi:RNase P subunit RPR2